MSKQTQRIEFELLDGLRDGSVQQQQSKPLWPSPPIYGHDLAHCEFQYRVFRDAYNRDNTCNETGGMYGNALTDAELRMRWLEYYLPHRDPSQQDIARWAHAVSRGHGADADGKKFLVCAFLVIALFLLLSK